MKTGPLHALLLKPVHLKTLNDYTKISRKTIDFEYDLRQALEVVEDNGVLPPCYQILIF